MLHLVGREAELKKLTEFYESPKAEFLAAYGRRRVGKTFLMQYFCQQAGGTCLHVTGIKDASLVEQIASFTKVVGKTFYQGAELQAKQTWLEVFEQLTAALENLPKHEKIILFFDEFPWMATKKSQLIQALDHYWNRYWSTDARIKLIVCGSAASWILENLVHNKGGLYNRITYQIELQPFSLKESREFLLQKKIKLSASQLLRLYMVVGGIPLYLDQIKKGWSVEQNIDALCFTRRGLLFNEFGKLFASLFDQYDVCEALVRHIATSRYGVPQIALMRQSAKSVGGRLKMRLQELEDAGFIESFLPYQHKGRGIYYRVIDEYTLFYLKWIEPVAHQVKRRDREEGYWLSKQKSPGFASWAGYAYEAVCYKHVSQIRRKLAIGPGAEVGAWRYVPSKGSIEGGAQIDLLFDRDDDAITICEIKYTTAKFNIDKAYAKQLRQKLQVFAKRTKTGKQLFVVLISSAGLKKSIHAEALVDGIVVLEDLFEA